MLYLLFSHYFEYSHQVEAEKEVVVVEKNKKVEAEDEDEVGGILQTRDENNMLPERIVGIL